MFSYCSFSSGSSGNSYLVFTETTSILVDAGITGKALLQGMEKCNISPGLIEGVFITHEHHDHVRGLPVILKAIAKEREDGSFPDVYGSSGTLSATEDRFGGRLDLSDSIILDPTDKITVGDIVVTPFRLSHDAAEPLGYRFDAKGKSLAVVTDTGIVNDSIFRSIYDSDYLIMEANHEIGMLLMGRYPYPLKKRILGDYGHLSNDAAAETLVQIMDFRKDNKKRSPLAIALAHLSRDNNTPDMAELTISNILFENNYIKDKHYTLRILERDTIGDIVRID